MKVRRIFSYLVAPGKHKDPPPEIQAADLPLKGRLYEMLRDLFDGADRDCDSSIRFLPDEKGRQRNPARDLIVTLLKRNDVLEGHKLATRLCQSTTGVSGLGLLFMIMGTQGTGRTAKHKVVLSRFPAEPGILASEGSGGLSVEFVEKVFMKNKKTYKAALYSGTSLEGGFWRGRAVDKQMDGTAAYWISGFLKSALLTNPAEGTRRLASALAAATRKSDDLAIQEEIIAIARLARQMTEAISTNELLQRLNATEPVKRLVRKQFPRGDLADDRFHVDVEEFDKIIRYRSVRLDNGGIMTAHAERFDEIFAQQGLSNDRVRFQTEGKIEDDQLRKAGR